MPLLAQSHYPIPAQDITSFCYENRNSYDQDKPIYIDTATGESISANEAYAYIRKLVAGFRAIGLQKGDVVCIHSFNQLFYPILVQGIIASGCIFVGTNPSYMPYELEHAIKISKAKVIIAEPELLKAPKIAAQRLGIPDSNILLFSDQKDDNHDSWRKLLNHGSQDWIHFNDEYTAKNTTAFLMFSSGTTGLPKAAQVSHYNIVAQHTLVHENPDNPFPFPVSMLCCLPFFHIAMAPYTHASTLRSGLPSHIMRRFEPWPFLDAIEKYQTTRIMIVPPIVIALLNCSLENEPRVRRSLRSIRAVNSGAAPLAAETQARLQRLLPTNTPFAQLFGMTETSCIAAFLYPPEADTTGSVGRPIPNVDVKVVDPENPEIEVGPYDTRGELCIRGPIIIRGYLDNPAANAESFDKEGFFHTGDIAICDSKSKLWYIVDRKKELIKVRGFQVSPAEIEGVLLEHPAIRDVGVIGVEHGEAGELPRAFVVKRDGMEVSEEVNKWVKERLASYKQLQGGVRFVTEIPKNASGKILKRILREGAKKDGSSKL